MNLDIFFKYSDGVISGLYNESSLELMKILKQPCNHTELIQLLSRFMKERNRSDLFRLSKKYRTEEDLEEPNEPLVLWIANNNYALTKPICNSRAEMLNYPEPERLLTYVYIILKYKYRQRSERYLFRQPHIEEIYQGYFDKSSEFKSWGLIPLDSERLLLAEDSPVRIYDGKFNKTIFLDEISHTFAKIIQQLMKDGYIQKASFRGSDLYIYDGENHLSDIRHAKEWGSYFGWDINGLIKTTKLYREPYTNDSLWIRNENKDLTFEELCDDVYDDGENAVTQMIHLRHEGNMITHIDHEFIFYDLEQYEIRKRNPYIKGDSRRRVKSFKIDDAKIPIDYPCKIHEGNEEIDVPFLFFVLYDYFEHKDLLEEYFQEILNS